MSRTYLQVTFYDGKLWAAYLELPRKPGDKAAHSKEEEAGLVVDFAPDGRPIGIEITSPSLFSVDALNRVLKSLNLNFVTDKDLSPLTFAA